MNHRDTEDTEEYEEGKESFLILRVFSVLSVGRPLGSMWFNKGGSLRITAV